MALRTVVPPPSVSAGGGLLTLADAKAHLRLDFDDDDVLVAGLVAAAGAMVEAETQRRFLAQTIEQVREDWADPMVLPVAGADGSASMTVDRITYVDLDGVTQLLDPGQYWVRPRGETLSIVRPWFVVWPWLGDGAERLVIRFSLAGDATTVPDMARHATRLLTSHFYQNRDAVVGVEQRDSSTPLPLGVEALLSPLRWTA